MFKRFDWAMQTIITEDFRTFQVMTTWTYSLSEARKLADLLSDLGMMVKIAVSDSNPNVYSVRVTLPASRYPDVHSDYVARYDYDH